MPLLLTNSDMRIGSDPKSQFLSSITEGSYGEIILVIPTNRNVRYLKHELVTKSAKALTSPDIYTLELLIRKIYYELNTGKFEIESDMQSILVEEAAAALIKENGLNYFGSKPDGKLPRGTFDQVFRIIREFKESGIYASDLEKDLSSIDEKEFEKTNDIIKIYKKYNTLLGDRFIDKGDIYKTVGDGFRYPFSEDIFRKVFPNAKEIFIYGFSEFSKPEILFLTELSSIRNLKIFFSFDYNPSNISLFGIMKQNVDNFFGLNFKEHIPCFEKEENPFRDHVETNLFSRKAIREVKDFSSKVTLFSSKDRLEEVELICKIIKSIIIENPGQDLNKICVATYSTGKYTDLFREYFEKFGIPVNITDRYLLSQSPVISAFISFLQIPVNNYRKKEIFRALLSPYMIFRRPNGKTIDANSLFEIANDLKIMFGKDSWKEKIDRRLGFLESKNRTDDEKNIENEIYKLKEAKKDFEFLVSLLSPFEKKLSAREFEIEILQLINLLEIPAQILRIKNSNNSHFLMEKDLRALTAFQSILKNMNNLYELRIESSSLYSLADYLSDLKTAVSNTRYNLKQRNSYGILVTAAEETRGLAFDYMFLAGMIDGEFPVVFKPEIFKPEIRRKSEEKHYLENRYLFYQTITNSGKKLFISYPKYENDTELIPSSFLSSLKEIITCDDNISSYAEGTVYSLEELQSLIGNHIKIHAGQPVLSDEFSGLFERLNLKSIIENSRSRTHNLKNYEGIISGNLSDNGVNSLSGYAGKEYSISELEEYGKCPMRYLFSRVLHINTPEEIDDDITAIEFGSIIHETLYEFFTEWKTANPGKSFYSPSDSDNQNNREKLINIAIKKVDELNITNPFFRIDFMKVIGDGTRKSGILKKFLSFELSEKNARFADMIFEPEYFEVSFGSNTGGMEFTDSYLSTGESILLNDIKMRGKVDRIDICRDAEKLFFAIFDYKTGKYIPGLRQITEGTSLQLPVYITCIEKLFSAKTSDAVYPAGGIYYLLNDQPALNPGLADKEYFSNSRSTKIMDHSKFRELLDRSTEYVKEYVTGITEGKFGFPKPERDLNEICKFCNFITICRIKAIKLLENNN